jgi:hypothetical protein
MDRAEGRRRKLREVNPAPEIPEELQIEPWAWGDKDMPESVAHRLWLYRQYIEGLPRNGD